MYAVEASGMANFARQLAERNPSIGKALQVSGWGPLPAADKDSLSDLEGWAEVHPKGLGCGCCSGGHFIGGVG